MYIGISEGGLTGRPKLVKLVRPEDVISDRRVLHDTWSSGRAIHGVGSDDLTLETPFAWKEKSLGQARRWKKKMPREQETDHGHRRSYDMSTITHTSASA